MLADSAMPFFGDHFEDRWLLCLGPKRHFKLAKRLELKIRIIERTCRGESPLEMQPKSPNHE